MWGVISMENMTMACECCGLEFQQDSPYLTTANGISGYDVVCVDCKYNLQSDENNELEQE